MFWKRRFEDRLLLPTASQLPLLPGHQPVRNTGKLPGRLRRRRRLPGRPGVPAGGRLRSHTGVRRVRRRDLPRARGHGLLQVARRLPSAYHAPKFKAYSWPDSRPGLGPDGSWSNSCTEQEPAGRSRCPARVPRDESRGQLPAGRVSGRLRFRRPLPGASFDFNDYTLHIATYCQSPDLSILLSPRSQ